jgi:hypothetical protein
MACGRTLIFVQKADRAYIIDLTAKSSMAERG